METLSNVKELLSLGRNFTLLLLLLLYRKCLFLLSATALLLWTASLSSVQT